jgi:hypothetical protein
MLKHYYQPYRAQAERLVRQAIADDRLVIHLSSHSFTPELDGKYETPISDCSMTRLDKGICASAGRHLSKLVCKISPSAAITRMLVKAMV